MPGLTFEGGAFVCVCRLSWSPPLPPPLPRPLPAREADKLVEAVSVPVRSLSSCLTRSCSDVSPSVPPEDEHASDVGSLSLLVSTEMLPKAEEDSGVEVAWPVGFDDDNDDEGAGDAGGGGVSAVPVSWSGSRSSLDAARAEEAKCRASFRIPAGEEPKGNYHDRCWCYSSAAPASYFYYSGLARHDRCSGQ